MLLTTREIASELQKSTRWVSVNAKAGVLPGVKVGGEWRFDLEKVLAHLGAPEVQVSRPRKRRAA